MPKSGVYYRVYKYSKVKHKVPFFDEQVYPVYITLIHGRKSLNFKSQLFTHMLKEKYHLSCKMNNCYPDLQDIISHEQTLVAFIIQKLGSHFSFQLFKKEYSYYSTDITHEVDKYCKHSLIQYFNQKKFNALEAFITKTADILTIDIILRDMRTSLTSTMLDKLFSSLLPYIRLFEFCKQRKSPKLPILTFFKFSQKTFHTELSVFLDKAGRSNGRAEGPTCSCRWPVFCASRLRIRRVDRAWRLGGHGGARLRKRFAWARSARAWTTEVRRH